MKKLVFILLAIPALLLFNTNKTTGQEEKNFRFDIKTNPLAALGGPIYVLWIVPVTAEYKVLFEAKTFQKQSFQLGLGYLGPSPLIAAIGNVNDTVSISASGFRVQGWYKFFITADNAPKGFYVGPHFSYATAKIKNTKKPSDYFQGNKLNVDVVLGYQVITKGGFALDIYTGLGIKSKTWTLSNQGVKTSFNSDWDLSNKTSIGVPFGISFGYAF